MTSTTHVLHFSITEHSVTMHRKAQAMSHL